MDMPDAIAARAASLLLTARRERRRMAALPEAFRPSAPEQGYRVQDAMAAITGADAGYKIGCTSARAREIIRTDEPFAGRLSRGAIHRSPAALPASGFMLRGIECEFAFRLGRDLPPRAAAYGATDVAPAVAAVVPAIEIVESVFEDWTRVGVASVIADNGGHGALVLGRETADWRGLDLERHAVTLSIDGKAVTAGTGAEALGGPLKALAWLATDRARRGDLLRAGQVVTTGTCAGFHVVAPGQEVRADFGVLGQVTLSFLADAGSGGLDQA
ncbi:MAG: fumarylacetoacetate hydrolase family protein [Alphaproteobacteria bacterium]|nr:fumarylacetoacetate hydrolase family protein [Alphaproteobacteria bacterium]